jgi:hypothetical protein
VPRISAFYGIVIYMYHRDHGAPHFHAVYAGQEAVISVRTLRVLEGRLPPRALTLVRTWARRHRQELARNWDLARANRSLRQIEPLD